MLLRKIPIAFSSLLFVLCHIEALAATEVEVRTTDDYIVLAFEAEDYSELDDRWVVTDPTTPTQENDPDPNHSDGAVGNTYLELLPDIRVKHGDSFGPPTAYWDKPGEGPKASYPINFPEAGRYYVHLRALSTGTEDNGIHIGINGTWPASGARMQFCAAGRGWGWSGRQRDSGGMGSCGAIKTIWVTVEEAGMHTLQISAREDGFEADRIMLMKDLSDNTRICRPKNENDIHCVNGSLENTDDVVDMAVVIEREEAIETIDIEESVAFSTVVRNLDGYDKAKHVVLALDLQVGTRWEVLSKSEECEVNENNQQIECSLGTVIPSGPEHEKVFDFVLSPLKSGSLPIPAVVVTSSVDGQEGNNAAQVEVEVTDAGSLSTLTANWADSSIDALVNTETLLSATVGNTGPADAVDARFSVSLASGLAATTLPAACKGTTDIVCEYDTFAKGETETLRFGVTPDRVGLASISILGTAANLDGEEESATVVLNVEQEEVEEQEEEVEKEEAENGTTAGSDTGEQQSLASNSTASSGSMGLFVLMMLVITLVFRAQATTLLRDWRVGARTPHPQSER